VAKQTKQTEQTATEQTKQTEQTARFIVARPVATATDAQSAIADGWSVRVSKADAIGIPTEWVAEKRVADLGAMLGWSGASVAIIGAKQTGSTGPRKARNAYTKASDREYDRSANQKWYNALRAARSAIRQTWDDGTEAQIESARDAIADYPQFDAAMAREKLDSSTVFSDAERAILQAAIG
jgi:hypothetical protein